MGDNQDLGPVSEWGSGGGEGVPVGLSSVVCANSEKAHTLGERSSVWVGKEFSL